MTESRIIPVKSLLSGKETTLYITQPPQSLYGGGNEQKRVIKGIIDDKPISVIERSNTPSSGNYGKKWTGMHNADVNVAPEVWEGEGMVFVADIKADGSETYGKGFHGARIDPTRSRPELDPFFLDITSPHKFPLVTETVTQAVAHANDNGILLPSDDPFELHLLPDESWKPVTLDLRYAEVDYLGQEKQFYSALVFNDPALPFDIKVRRPENPYSYEERFSTHDIQRYVVSKNRSSGDYFLRNLEKIRKTLTK